MIETIDMGGDKFRLSCSLYELIEVWSMRKTDVVVVYVDDEGIEQSLEGVITNVYSRNGQEQIVVNNDIIIPTKNIFKINDVVYRT